MLYQCTVFAMVWKEDMHVSKWGLGLPQEQNCKYTVSASDKLEWIWEVRQTEAKKRKEEESGTCCNTECTNCPSHMWQTSFQSHTANQQQLQLNSFPENGKRSKTSRWMKRQKTFTVISFERCGGVWQNLIDTHKNIRCYHIEFSTNDVWSLRYDRIFFIENK